MAFPLFYSLVALVLIVFQTTFISKMQIWGVSADLLLITVIYLSLTRGGLLSLLLVLFYGHLLDICSAAYNGFFVYSFLMLFFIIRFVKRIVLLEEREYLVIWVGIYSVVQGILLCILARFHFVGEGFISSVVIRLLIQALYNMVIALILFPIFSWFEKILGIIPVEDHKRDFITTY